MFTPEKVKMKVGINGTLSLQRCRRQRDRVDGNFDPAATARKIHNQGAVGQAFHAPEPPWH